MDCRICGHPLSVNDKMRAVGEWAGMCASCIDAEKAKRETDFAAMVGDNVVASGDAVHVAGAADGRPGEAARLVVSDRGICLGSKNALRWKLLIPHSAVKEMNVLTSEQVSALRVVALGILGALLKKKERYLDIRWDAGGLESHLVVGGVQPESVIAAIMKAREIGGQS